MFFITLLLFLQRFHGLFLPNSTQRALLPFGVVDHGRLLQWLWVEEIIMLSVTIPKIISHTHSFFLIFLLLLCKCLLFTRVLFISVICEKDSKDAYIKELEAQASSLRIPIIHSPPLFKGGALHRQQPNRKQAQTKKMILAFFFSFGDSWNFVTKFQLCRAPP